MLPPFPPPPPQADATRHPPITRNARHRVSSLLRSCLPNPAVLTSMSGISRKPNARDVPERCAATCGEAAAAFATVETVRVVVPDPLAIVICPAEQLGPCVASGLTEHAKDTPAGENPFTGAIVTVELADWPAATDEGDSAEAERVKPAETSSEVEALAPKLVSPG